MNKVKKVFLGLALSLSLFGSSYPIQQSTAYLLSGATGVGAGLGYYHFVNEKIWQAGLCGIVSAGFAYLFLREFTPEVKFERAKNKLLQAETGLFATYIYESNRAFFNDMDTAYAAYDLPLAAAFKDLDRRLHLIQEAKLLFEDANSQLENIIFRQLCSSYIKRSYSLSRTVVDAIKRIKGHRNFTEQLKIYEKRRISEKRLEIEGRKASAQESNALAQHNQAWAQHRQANAQQQRNNMRRI